MTPTASALPPDDTPPATAPEAPEAAAERTLLLYRIGRTGVLIHSLLIGSALYLFWGSVPPVPLIGWAVIMFAITVWRALWCRRVTDTLPPTAEMPRYQRLYDLNILLTGLWWGVGTYLLFVPDDPGRQAVLALLIGGTAAGAVGTLSADFATTLRALVPSLLPLSANFLLRGQDETADAIGGLMILFLGALIMVARNFNRTLREALRLRYELAAKSRTLEADIARREAIEAALREANQRAEAAVSAKSRFVARASHDLRQPLHALGLLVATLDHRLTAPEDRDILDRVEQSLDGMSLLFNALLDISRLDAGALQPEIRTVRLDEVLHPIVQEFTLLAEIKGLRLRYRPTDSIVRTDPALLSAVVRNLLSNAVRYTAEGGLLIGGRIRGGRYRLQVWDTGQGIPEDQHQSIFEDFSRVPGTPNDPNHFGLGLSIVRRIAGLLDHPLGLRSRPGRGTVFSLDVPLAATGQSPSALQTEHGLAPRSLTGLRLLVIDDDEDGRNAMRLLLTGWGATVDCVAGRAQAEAAVRAAPPHAIIADLDLAEGDSGRAVIAHLRAHLGRPVPAMLITGDSAAQPQPGDPLFLHKPVAPGRLRSVLNRWTARAPAA